MHFNISSYNSNPLDAQWYFVQDLVLIINILISSIYAISKHMAKNEKEFKWMPISGFFLQFVVWATDFFLNLVNT